MNKNATKSRANYERNKIKKLLKAAGVDDNTISMLWPTIQNIGTLKAKLDDIQGELEEASLLIDWDNGGGQTGTKENPVFRMYESMWKSYTAGIKMVMSYIPEEQKKAKGNGTQNVLQLVREKHVKKA